MSDETSDLPRWLLLRDEEVQPTKKQVVNDVKITEFDGVTVTNNGGIGLVVTTVSGTVRILGSDEVAALREHFAAEQPAPEVNSDGMPYNNASRDELVGILSRWLGVPEVNVRRIWQPATPTPSEVIDWIENRSPHTLLVAVKEAREHFAALTSPSQNRDITESHSSVTPSTEQIAAIRSHSHVAIHFDSGTTYVVTGENAGSWVEGAPTHVPIPSRESLIDLLTPLGRGIVEYPGTLADAILDALVSPVPEQPTPAQEPEYRIPGFNAPFYSPEQPTPLDPEPTTQPGGSQ